jgi:ubiquinone/menaquinone biosynthesis C-methylase UbiE
MKRMSQEKMYEFQAIDEQILHALENHPPSDQWLLIQAVLASSSRRAILRRLPFRTGSKVLDVGTGYGVIPLEIASLRNLDVVGVDVDEDKIDLARDFLYRMSKSADMKGRVRFEPGDAYCLPFGDESFDLVIAWYVFQHLQNPITALGEIRRVLKPGGHAAIIDIDDQLVLVYPEPIPESQLLRRLFEELQKLRGGDRRVGRKLSTYLHKAGFENVETAIISESSHGRYLTTDPNHRMLIYHYLSERKALVAHGLITDEQFQRSIEALSRPRPVGQRFTANGHVLALGTHPVGEPDDERKQHRNSEL